MTQDPKPARVTVADVMSKGLHTIALTATVHDAVHEMQRLNISSLVVERKDEHDEYGLLTVKDIARHVIAENKSLDRVYVYEVVSKPVLSVPPDMSIKHAIHLLVNFKVGRTLVMDGNRTPVGLVTVRDMILRMVA